MFERRNQSILTPHYSALVAHDEDAAKNGEEDDDEVFTIARRNHALDDEGADLADGDLVPTDRAEATPLISSEDLSKRKLKAASSKKHNLKNRPAPEKLVFDDEGQATNFYESGVQAEQGAGAEAARKEFFERERQQMREADKVDRAAAREAKREKKRKRKEREREVSLDVAGVYVTHSQAMDMGDDYDEDEGPVAYLAGGEDFDSTDDAPVVERSSGKKQKQSATIEDEEALALRLLQG